MLDTIRHQEPMASPTTATLVGWNSLRGFGFFGIGDAESVFVHVTAFEAANLEPRLGAQFSFDVIPDRRGRRQAANLRRG